MILLICFLLLAAVLIIMAFRSPSGGPDWAEPITLTAQLSGGGTVTVKVQHETTSSVSVIELVVNAWALSLENPKLSDELRQSIQAWLSSKFNHILVIWVSLSLPVVEDHTEPIEPTIEEEIHHQIDHTERALVTYSKRIKGLNPELEEYTIENKSVPVLLKELMDAQAKRLINPSGRVPNGKRASSRSKYLPYRGNG